MLTTSFSKKNYANYLRKMRKSTKAVGPKTFTKKINI